MDPIPEIIGEAEFRNFTKETYAALAKVMDDVIASYLLDYCNAPDADASIKSDIENYLGDLLKQFTFHLLLHEKGIIDMITTLSPETVLTLSKDEIAKIKSNLTYLNDNLDLLMSSIKGRTNAEWQEFKKAYVNVLNHMRLSNLDTTYDDMLNRIEANKFIFYVPNSKGHSTRTGAVYSKKRQWLVCLRGIEFDEYCKQHGITEAMRRMF